MLAISTCADREKSFLTFNFLSMLSCLELFNDSTDLEIF